MFFVEAKYDRGARGTQRVPGRLRYMAHREERAETGRSRELYGIGPRFRALRGNEPAIRRAFLEDARGQRNPVHFRFILTVDERTAGRFARLDGPMVERVLRDAVQKTFRAEARTAQGVFVVHQHGGKGRQAHPHVHALLSSRLENGKPTRLSPARIQNIRHGWMREVLRELERQERRAGRGKEPARTPLAPWRLSGRLRSDRKQAAGWRFRPWAIVFFRRHPERLLARLAGRGIDQAARVIDRAERGAENPERTARRVTFSLIARALPSPLREAVRLGRGLTGLGRWSR